MKTDFPAGIDDLQQWLQMFVNCQVANIMTTARDTSLAAFSGAKEDLPIT